MQAAPPSVPGNGRLLGAAFDHTNRVDTSGWVAHGKDQMRTVSRFRADGAVDTSMAPQGWPRANVGGVVSPVLFRLTAAGALDPTSARAGIAVRRSLGAVTEAYAVTHAGDRLVTTGYGKDTAEAKVDLVANSFTLDGAADVTFGNGGLTRVDVAGEDDRGGNLATLPDGRTILVGSGKTGSDIDGMVVRLTADGNLDASFGEGRAPPVRPRRPQRRLLRRRRVASATRVAAVGYLGREADKGDDDDGAVLWLEPDDPVPPDGPPSRPAAPVP